MDDVRSAARRPRPGRLAWIALFSLGAGGPGAAGQEPIIRILPPDQHHIEIRDPACLPHARIPEVASPPTVSDPRWNEPGRVLGLDEAIRITLQNSEVIRILTGVTASASGATIYDPAVANTAIDVAKARFDPNVTVQNAFSKTREPAAFLDPLDPTRALIDGVAVHDYTMNFGLSKVNSFGGTAQLGVNVDSTKTTPGDGLPLNPQTRSAVTLSYTQPLLQGGGAPANLAPIVIARINTERSFFQLKDAVQQSVRGVIQAYWSLVFARTDVWARRRQVEQGEETVRRAEARLRAGLADLAEVAQARSALANFRANLITSEANELNDEAVLANLLRLAPSTRLVPVSPPSRDRVTPDWDALLRLAEVRRPDLIELKLVLEADQQVLIQNRNQARPRLDATLLYRWNGLEGIMPNGQELASSGRFNDWTAGVNFSVPLGLRAGRAGLRQAELNLARDRANLDQGLFNAAQLLALDVRNLASFYEQYRAFSDARVAARADLDRQVESYRRGRSIILNVLQAIVTWGNTVSSESQALTQYNAALAVLEAETGTILETHGVRFFEERYASLGPLGALGHPRIYPEAMKPGPNAPQYPTGPRPAEESFNLEDPLKARRLGGGETLPAPRPVPPTRTPAEGPPRARLLPPDD